MLVKLNKKQLQNCEDFAVACVGTNNYHVRNQYNKNKIVQDIVNGKQAELAVHKLLVDFGYDISDVDFEVYPPGKKSHGKDLIVEGRHIEIKSQTIDSMERYGMSWLLEKKATKKLKDHILIVCTVLEPGRVLINNVMEFGECPLGEPKLKHLTTKAAIYYEDLLKQRFEELL